MSAREDMSEGSGAAAFPFGSGAAPAGASTSELLQQQIQLMNALLQQQQQRGPHAKPRVHAHPPPTYDGREQKYPAKRWIIAMEQYFNVTEVAEHLRVGLAANALRDAAQSWWLTLPKQRVEPSTNQLRDMNWKEFAEALMGHFCPQRYEENARYRLWNVRQSGSVRQYIRDFQEVIVDITDATDAELKDRFVHNLKDYVRREVMQQQPTSLAQAYNAAELWRTRVHELAADKVEHHKGNVSGWIGWK